MLIARSLWRKLLATLVVVVGFVLLYEATVLDSRFALARRIIDFEDPGPALGTPLEFRATAYCKGTTTASGVVARSGVAAADPDLLPVGSVVQVDAPGDRHDGVYTIMDTGPKVQGRKLDLYMWSCHEALAFGHRAITLTVLRLGWNPQASKPGLVERLFRRREAAKRENPVQPLPLPPMVEQHIPLSSRADPQVQQQAPPEPPADASENPDVEPVPELPPSPTP
jgi:3D (Asp-Asp-Asp) domain-containing protein